MPHFAPNKLFGNVKRRYFELIRAGVSLRALNTAG